MSVISSAGSSVQPTAPGPQPRRGASGGGSFSGQFSKVNGTPVWGTIDVPNDGKPHLVLWAMSQVVTALETGGGVQLQYTSLGNALISNINGGNSGAGQQTAGPGCIVADPGSTVTLLQNSPLTAGGPTTMNVVTEVL